MPKTIPIEEIQIKIRQITKDSFHVLDCYPATVQVNAPRALMQLEATSKLNVLYGLLNEKRPKFKCDDFTKTDY